VDVFLFWFASPHLGHRTGGRRKRKKTPFFGKKIGLCTKEKVILQKKTIDFVKKVDLRREKLIFQRKRVDFAKQVNVAGEN